jgi:hypothetical protein
MKRYICGEEIGYLMKKEDVEKKLKERFDFIKDREISFFFVGDDYCEISLTEVEDKGDYLVSRNTKERYRVPKELIEKLLDVKNISYFSERIINNNKIKCVDFSKSKNIHYFIGQKKQDKWDHIGSIEDVE